MHNSTILTSCQAASVLQINENTLNALAIGGKIPHIRIPSTSGYQMRFNTVDITTWLKHGLILNNNTANVNRYKRQLIKQFPEELAELQRYNKQFAAPRKTKGYCLSKVANKKLGFAYYVRYMEQGRTVPTRWSTHTNNEEAAHEFAACSRGKLLSEYNQRKAQSKLAGSLYPIMKKYYEKNSPYLKKDTLRGRVLGETARRSYHNSILRHWIPFLKKNYIKKLEEIDTPLLARFQDCCLAKGLKPQTVNHYVSFVSNIFDYLVMRGQIKTNPCGGLTAIRVREGGYEARGCYHINEVKGVFNKRWQDEQSYLLNLVIYSTGMRNSEIDRIQVKDIIRINKCRFIKISKSKTRYGERLVPLSEFVYNKLSRYIAKNKKDSESLLFCRADGKKLPRRHYTNANLALGKHLRYDKAGLKKENITFYSGRHFWKTLMNANDLGEVEEYFMGHKVSNDVAKRYNHRDRQGQEKTTEKAGKVFKILNTKLFTS
jgi:integrase